MSEDLRASKRAVLRVRATLSAPDGSSGIARTLDISSGGLCILTDRPLPPKARLTVAFEVTVQGKRSTVSAVAQVQWCMLSSDQFKSGLQFTSVAPTSRETIDALIAAAL